jgi:hypothetical protein
MSETVVEKDAVASFGGQLDAEATAAAEFPNVRTRLKLENSLTLRTHMIRIYAEARAGKISTLEANRLVRLLSEIGKVNAEVGVERRLDRIEEHIETQTAGRRRGR